MNYYNDNEKFAANWLRELIKEGMIPNGEVDERSITDIEPADLDGFVQCHFFAGIGGWPYALRLAGWPDDRPVWTGSCPCQPFSVAGKGGGLDDERHLWPAFRWLIAQHRPSTVFGEQVASKDGRDWLSGVRTDLEAMGYAVGAADLCAAGIGAPHIRQRLFWMADSQQQGLEGCYQPGHMELHRGTEQIRPVGQGGASHWQHSILIPCADGKWRRVPGRVADTETTIRRFLRKEHIGRWHEKTGRPDGIIASRDAENILEIEPLLFPLDDGIPNRVGALRGAGNAIVPQLAAEFIMAYKAT
ncbi:DNA cytosine methyltransferase [uncultured Desulfosarcina sp.]|uniref:DNA cytosine methyltransferase n=1 Tax=uncultured Desulfosarcina sp. TaxID=218289 RepID=UPI0029C96795|nr:DNA cytosine methyltransferase [uncultured Desulfosarcina sp.]